MIGQKARYELHNKASLESGKPNIVDLPSGYSPRGFRMADAGKKYYGFDLPIVIDTMTPAAEKTMIEEQRALAEYHAVDATKYGITIHFFEHQGHSLESVADKVVDLAIKFFLEKS